MKPYFLISVLHLRPLASPSIADLAAEGERLAHLNGRLQFAIFFERTRRDDLNDRALRLQVEA